MPIRYEPDYAAHIVRVTATGRVGFEEILALLEKLRADVPARLHELSDYRDATMDLSAAELTHLARVNSEDYADVRGLCVAVVVPPGLQHGIARMFAGHLDADVEFRVLQDFDEAEAWILAAAAREAD